MAYGGVGKEEEAGVGFNARGCRSKGGGGPAAVGRRGGGSDADADADGRFGFNPSPTSGGRKETGCARGRVDGDRRLWLRFDYLQNVHDC